MIDEIDENNKYFKQELKKITKNPFYKIDYKREFALIDAKVVRENAKIESKDL